MSGKDRAPASPERPGDDRNPGRPVAGSAGSRPHASSEGLRGSGADPSGTRRGDENAGWVVVSYLLAGMFIYGGLGWLIGHLIGAVTAALTVGLLVGLALGVTLVIFRFGRS